MARNNNNGENVNPSDVLDPYYIHPSDNPTTEERQQNYGSNKSPDAKVEETNVLANSVESGGVNCNFKKGREYNGYQVGRGRVNSSKEKVCTYYGNNGHMVDVCYRKYVYPPG
ncbi:hypothetical protein KIW84_065050 [Lathyrus oleraceus]|uniref:Uncharacterized protein n=1 Tax=Pisum sativum TaxID=3888 RepID=A0A9D4WDY0_PEA|nr:hypothetical protein KIW84_065050 [Pisum sativum]